MRLNKSNPKNHTKWCLKQKRGIKLVDPNDNLCDVYIKKSKSSLNVLNSAIEINEVDWIAATAYYARYFIFYAMLQKCGIKCEIHDCTITLMNFLLIDENIVDKKFFEEFELAKDLRVETQYYVSTNLDLDKLKKDSLGARNFVLKIEEVIENLTQEQIKKFRDKIKFEQ